MSTIRFPNSPHGEGQDSLASVMIHNVTISSVGKNKNVIKMTVEVAELENDQVANIMEMMNSNGNISLKFVNDGAEWQNA